MKQKLNHSELQKVSVILPAHNEETHIGDCLQSLENQSYPKEKLEIIVVDNNSKDRTTEIVKAHKVMLLEKPNGLVGSVRNHGFLNSSGGIIAFLDADCVAPKDWVAEGVALLKSESDHVFGGFCLVKEKPSFIEKYWILQSESPQKDLLGAAIFIRREHFVKAGLFDENITSGEDSKLSATLRKNGIRVKLSEKISVIHLGNPTNVGDFIIRQIWHSENYFQDIKSSVRDPVFILVLLWTLALVIAPVSFLVLENKIPFLFILVFLALVPTIFSAKRIYRSKNPLENIGNIHKIYYLDFLYMVGRAIGFIKSFYRFFINKIGQKS